MKKVAVVILALAMLVCLSVNVLAAEDKKIIVNDEREYDVFQIFTGDLYTETNNGVVTNTLSNIKWGTNGTGTTGQEVDQTVLDALKAVNGSADTAKLAVIEPYVNFKSTPIGTVKKDTPLTVTTGYYILRDKTVVGDGQERSAYVVEIVGDTTITAKAMKSRARILPSSVGMVLMKAAISLLRQQHLLAITQ